MSYSEDLERAAQALYEQATNDKPWRKDWSDDNWIPAVRQTWYDGVEVVLEQMPRVLREEQCCELACNGGACEGCPCCAAGWCVRGCDFPDPGVVIGDWEDENWTTWVEVAAEYNPIAKALLETHQELLETRLNWVVD